MRDPSSPPIEWFAEGIIDRRKFDEYLLSPTHRGGVHKLRLWQSVFGIGEGAGELLERLVREQLTQAEPVEREEKAAREDPSALIRRWELVIPRFRGPNGNEGPVRTTWALSPGREKPHLVTAFPLVG